MGGDSGEPLGCLSQELELELEQVVIKGDGDVVGCVCGGPGKLFSEAWLCSPGSRDCFQV